MHICVSKLTIIGSDNGLSPDLRQAIIWTNAGILSIGPLGTKLSEILIAIHIFSFKKMHLKMSSGKWQPCCLGFNVLKMSSYQYRKLYCGDKTDVRSSYFCDGNSYTGKTSLFSITPWLFHSIPIWTSPHNSQNSSYNHQPPSGNEKYHTGSYTVARIQYFISLPWVPLWTCSHNGHNGSHTTAIKPWQVSVPTSEDRTGWQGFNIVWTSSTSSWQWPPSHPSLHGHNRKRTNTITQTGNRLISGWCSPKQKCCNLD